MAKSSFWDDLGNTLTRKAKGLSSRAENLYEIQKIRNKLSAQERMTEKLMMDKFNRWYNMVWMEKMIGEHKSLQPEVKLFPEIQDKIGFERFSW